MAYKMKGFSGFGNSPAKQKKSKAKLQGPIPEQNIPLQPGEHSGTWIYGRGYKDEDPKEGIKEMKSDEKRMGKGRVKSERIIDYDERAGALEQNDLADINHMLKKDPKNKKLLSQKKKLKQTIETLDHEAQLMRDRS